MREPPPDEPSGWPRVKPAEPVFGSTTIGDSESWVCPNCGSINISSGTQCYACQRPRPTDSVEPADQRSNGVHGSSRSDQPTTMYWNVKEPAPWLVVVVVVFTVLAVVGFFALIIIGLSP
jgi:hypothetical protein